MKAIILAAGYGTRLQRDIENDPTGRFSHLSGTPKPLLPVGPTALISHWVRALGATQYVDAVLVVTNSLFLEAFEKWAVQFPNVKVLSDGTTSNGGDLIRSTKFHDIAFSIPRALKLHHHSIVVILGGDNERLGAVACLQLVIKHFKIEDHVIVIGGDTLFKEDFSLATVITEFSDLQAKCNESNLVLSYECKDDETSKYGILEVDADLRVRCMKEKPLPSQTNSRRACPCFYLLSESTIALLDVFLEEKKAAPIEERDAPGNFLSWLILRKPVYIHRVSGRFDVGNLAAYIECDNFFKNFLQLKSYLM